MTWDEEGGEDGRLGVMENNISQVERGGDEGDDGVR